MSMELKHALHERTAGGSPVGSPALPKFGGLMLAGLAVVAASLLARGQSVETAKAAPAPAEGRRAEELRRRAARLADRISNAADQVAKAKEAVEADRIQVRQAENSYNQARYEREVAELAPEEYLQGEFLAEKDKIAWELSFAEQKIQMGQMSKTEIPKLLKEQEQVDLKNNTKSVYALYELRNRIAGAESEMQSARFAMEAAMTKRKVLEGFEKPKKIKALNAVIEAARASELRRKSALEQAKSSEAAASRRVDELKLSSSEMKAVKLLEEAFDIRRKLQEAKEPTAQSALAQSFADKLEAAERLWDDEQDRRAEARFRMMLKPG